MIYRLALIAALLPLASFGQLQLFLFDGTTETPLGVTYDAGTVAPGDTLELRIRVRNMSTGAINLQAISIAGNGFKIAAAPSLPFTLAPGNAADFRTAFTPTGAGTYNASLMVNNLTLGIHAISAAAPSLYLDGASTPLMASGTIDFGSIERGSSRLLGLRLSNGNATAVKIDKLSVSGAGFRGPIGLAAPVSLQPGQSATFQIAFEPQTGQSARGTLTADQRTFNLSGQGLDPPLPSASIAFDSRTAASAKQIRVSIPLASASKVSGTGTLTLEFHPAIAGASDDSAVQFLSGPKRAATVTISAGDTAAKFGASADIAFQSGTTAGDIVFTLKLANGVQQSTLTVAPAPIAFDLASAVARIRGLDVSLTGFDNTHSASQLAFTFFDRSGKTIPPGQIRADASSDFRRYFDTGLYGGTFALRATFPLTGDYTQVGAVAVEMTNSVGVTKIERISF